MKVAITDANIFIDLIKLDLLDLLFNINIEIVTNELVLDELNQVQLSKLNYYIESNFLNIHKSSELDIEAILKTESSTRLSFQDKSIIYLAIENHYSILTGDNLVRKFCLNKNLDVRGILWLLDSFIEFNLISKDDAKKKLELLMQFNNRVPMQECKERLEKWKNNINI